MIVELGGFHKNLNCDNQFNVPAFRNCFSKQGTKLWFSQPEQPLKNAIIERFWITLALLIQRMRTGVKSFDWAKELPNVINNYNTTYHITLKATPHEVFEGKKYIQLKRKY
jgi:transposase InsO family protein